MAERQLLAGWWLLLFLRSPDILASSLQLTETPPLLDSPTFSLATRNEDGSTNMNILTYATPVSVRPTRVWCLGLFKDTLSYENFARTGTGILQLLQEDEHHIAVVKVLGGTSGREVDKQAACAKLDCAWIDLDDDQTKVLPNCASYCRLSAIGELVDVGSHSVAICQVDEMYASNSSGQKKHLSTAKLRELGIITEQGRVAKD